MTRLFLIKIMKQLLIFGCMSVCGALTALAVDPFFENISFIISPPDNAPVIDAYAWTNRAPFTVTTTTGFGLPIPFESQHTLFFQNSSTMTGNPGFRFYNNVGPRRFWMDTWTNNGTISSDNALIFSANGTILGTFVGSFFGFNSQPSIVLVQATNIASTGTGTLRSGAEGLIHLEGKNINLKRNGLRTGSPSEDSTIIFGGGFLLSTNYVNDFGIFDLYWGAGTNNMLNGRGPGMQIDGMAGIPNFTPPAPFSPDHEVFELFNGLQFRTFELLPRFNTNGNFNNNNFGVAVWTNQTSPSTFVVQVVFYPTNYADTNFTSDVTFVPGFGANGASLVVVGFHSIDFDIVDQTFTSTSVYLADALATTTNAILARNQAFNTRRPDTFEVSRIPPFGLGGFGFFNSPGNASFESNLLWRPTFQFNTVTNIYAAYDAQIVSVTTASGLTGDPTNFPGRIQIIGEEVDLDKTRIRAESSLVLKASKNLTSNHVAQVDAPWINFDATSLAPQLVISNLAPMNVRRFAGDIAAYSTTWTNYEAITDIVNSGGTLTTNVSTNTIFFHVLMVDPNIQTLVPVTVNEFAAHVNNLIVCDNLSIGKSFIADSVGLYIKGGVTMPFSGSWGATNLPRVANFTNDGTVNILRVANNGADRATPYDNYINRGTNTAGTQTIKTRNFEDSGSLIASSGLLKIDTTTASMISSNPLTYFTDITTNVFYYFTNITLTNFIIGSNVFVFTNTFTNDFGARIQGNSDVQITAQDMVVSNSFFLAAGKLTLSVSGRLVDSGVLGTNRWSTAAGIDMTRRPITSDLIGTYITATALGFDQESFNSWSADDRGVSVTGYSNNLAVGKLTLDGGRSSVFHFAPPENQSFNAIYVDYLELLNYATNYDNTFAPSALDISPGFTIYFANANVNPVKLNVSNNGRLRWVSEFTGPLSSTNITYPSGQTYTFNTALVQSKEIDSDGDGLVNANDPTPLPEPNAITIAMTKSLPHRALLSWYSKARSTNRIEYRLSGTSTNWQVLTNIVNGSTPGTLQAQDMVPMTGTRFYRLRMDLPR